MQSRGNISFTISIIWLKAIQTVAQEQEVLTHLECTNSSDSKHVGCAAGLQTEERHLYSTTSRERACEIRNEIGQISAVMDGERVGRDTILAI